MTNPIRRGAIAGTTALLALSGCVGDLRGSDPNGYDIRSPYDAGPRTQRDVGISRHDDAAAHVEGDAAGLGPVGESDAGLAAADAASSAPDAPATTPEAPDASAALPDSPPPTCTDCACIDADLLFAEDFEAGSPSHFTGGSYDDAWGDSCQNNRTQGAVTHGGAFAQRSEIVCASSTDLHRGYGGVQFDGDRPLPGYTNTGTGIRAPNGMVSTHWINLRTGHPIADGRWISLFTVNPTCDYTTQVITVGLDQPDGMLHAAHYWPEGTEQVVPGAVPLPRDRWVRLTVYLDLDSGILHVWQDGVSTLHVTGFVRPVTTYCQWHWGLYGSGDNTDIVLHEDDFAVHRLNAPWTEWDREPWIGAGGSPACP